MKRLTAIVVEDERLPRLALLQKLELLHDRVEVVAACETYDDALQTIVKLRPDLLLLDIQLQGCDSIALLDELKQSITLPPVIFTTAYADRRYLMGAIKVMAVDYLMKPVNRNDLVTAIAKAEARLAAEAPASPATGKMALRTVNGKLFVEPVDIAAVRANGNYSRLVSFDGEEDVFESMASLERALDKSMFARVDRSTIVNITLLHRLNVKRRQCTLRAPSGATLTLELSKVAVEALSRLR